MSITQIATTILISLQQFPLALTRPSSNDAQPDAFNVVFACEANTAQVHKRHCKQCNPVTNSRQSQFRQVEHLHYTAPHWPWQVHDRTFFWRIYDQDAVRKGNWKYFRDGTQRRLFDLSSDSHEQADFSRRNPEMLEQLASEFEK